MTDRASAVADDEGVVIHEHFDCSKEELWHSITDSEELSAWLGGRCAIEPEVGGAVTLALADAGIVGHGVVREWSPPQEGMTLASINHTFVDEASPDVQCVCSWLLVPSGNGCELRFQMQGVEDADQDKLAGKWEPLGVAISAGARPVARRTTSIDEVSGLLRAASDIVLIDWVTKDIPRTLVEAGFSVVSKNGPEPDNFGRAEVRDGELSFTDVDPPRQADLLHLDHPLDFDEVVEFAKTLGVKTFWYHSATTKPPAPVDKRGRWVPNRKSARQRALAEAAGMSYIDDHYIVDVARHLLRERAPGIEGA